MPIQNENKINNLILEVNHTCNNNCIYCYIPKENRSKRTKDSFYFFKNQLTTSYKEGTSNVDFTGGEPTLYSGLNDLIEASKKMGFKNRTLVTNGRRLAYKECCDKLVKSGITRVVVSLDGDDRKTAETITRVPGSFKQTVAGIKNIKKQGIELGITLVINQLNYKKTSRIIRYFTTMRPQFINIQFLLPFVEDKLVVCQRIPHAIIPRYDAAVKYVKKALDKYGGKTKINVHFIPFCLMRGYEQYLDKESTKFDRLIVNYLGYSYNVGEHLKKDAVKIQKCEHCSYNAKCSGFFKSYSDQFGTYMEIKNGA